MAIDLLLIDGEEQSRKYLSESLSPLGYRVVGTAGFFDGMELLTQQRFAAVILDSRFVGPKARNIQKIRKTHSPSPVVLVTGESPSVERAKECIDQGATEFLVRPFNIHQIHYTVQRVMLRRRLRREEEEKILKELDESSRFGLVGKSVSMLQVYEMIKAVASSSVPVLILGESGAGKELVAHAVHGHGPRAAESFTVINCSALPQTLLESELFGHLRGAFTGADNDRMGLLESADGGTVFLDEIGEIPLSLQSKLLRFLESKEVRRIGGTKSRKVDVRIITATNKDLRKLAQDGLFRQDLYFRISVVPINLPPLRERREDIPLLAHYFTQYFGEKMAMRSVAISDEAMSLLLRFEWPGNVRELRNVVERAMALSSGGVIFPRDLPENVRLSSVLMGKLGTKDAPYPTLQEAMRAAERKYILEILEMCGWRKKETAERLRINPSTLWKKMNALGIRRIKI